MPKGTRICKICGREYPYCKTNRPADIFRWQDVGCCVEHAAIYFERIAESRSQNQVNADSEELRSEAPTTIEETEEEYDSIDELDEDDELEELEIEL